MPSAGTAHEKVAVSEATAPLQTLERVHQEMVLGRLFPGVLHEVNNALGIVLGYADLLGDVVPAEDQGPLDAIQEAASECQELLGQLVRLVFGSDTGERSGAAELVALSPLLERVGGLVRKSFERAGCRLVVDPSLEGEAWVDPRGLERSLVFVLVDVLTALRGDGREGAVTLRSAQPSEGLARLLLECDGPALSLECGQEASPSTGRGPTQGFGLVLARRWAEEGGGALRLGRARCGGAELEICLPSSCRGSAS